MPFYILNFDENGIFSSDRGYKNGQKDARLQQSLCEKARGTETHENLQQIIPGEEEDAAEDAASTLSATQNRF